MAGCQVLDVSTLAMPVYTSPTDPYCNEQSVSYNGLSEIFIKLHLLFRTWKKDLWAILLHAHCMPVQCWMGLNLYPISQHLYSLPTFCSFIESASQWREEAWWRPKWLPNYIRWPSSRPLRLANFWLGYYSHPVAIGCRLTLCLWRRQCGGIILAVGGQNQWKGKSGGTEKGQGRKE